MSTPGTGWFAAPNKIFGDTMLSALDKLVFLYLIRCAGPDGGAWPSHRKIAEDCGICEKTVRNCLKNLVELGRIGCKNRKTESGSKTSNLYSVEKGSESPPSVRDTDTIGKRYRSPSVRDTDKEDPLEEDPIKESPLNPPKGKKPKVELAPIPEDLLPAKTAIENFIAHRKEIKKPLTPRALEIVFGKARKWGFARFLQSVEDSIQGGYQGLFEPRRVSDITAPQLSREERRRLTT